MIRFNSSYFLRTALVVVSISTTSCGSAGNYILTGHWEDPNAEEVSTAPKSAPTNAVSDEKKVEPTNAAPEPVLQAFPNETPFTYGIWTLYRNARGMFFWTGKGDTLRLVALELGKDEPCWFTRRADGPRVMHCLDKHFVLLRDLEPDAGSSGTPPSAGRDALNGLADPPWRNNALAPSNLAVGNYDLPDRSGGKNGTFSIEVESTKIKIQLPPIMGKRWFVLTKDNNDVNFNGESVSLFDGCTEADRTLALLPGLAIQWDKKTCGIHVDANDYMVSLTTGDFKLDFKIMDTPPDLAARQEEVKKLRKQAVENFAMVDMNVTGDSMHTLVAGQGKNREAKVFALVESHRTVGTKHFRCTARLDGDAVSQLPRAKQICLSMRAPQ